MGGVKGRCSCHLKKRGSNPSAKHIKTIHRDMGDKRRDKLMGNSEVLLL